MCSNCFDLAFCFTLRKYLYLRIILVRGSAMIMALHKNSLRLYIIGSLECISCLMCVSMISKAKKKRPALMNFICSSFKRTLCFVYLRGCATAFFVCILDSSLFILSTLVVDNFSSSFTLWALNRVCARARMVLLPPPGKTRQRNTK